MNAYQKLSVLYYNQSKPIGTSLGGDLEFYHQEIMHCKNVLEAGVGTGRLLIPYLEKGITIEGIDLSQDMIDLCGSNCAQHQVKTRLEQGDVEIFKFQHRYDAIIIPTGTFCLFDNVEAVLKNFYDHLEVEGMILFDLIFPTEFKQNESFVYSLDLPDEKKLILTDYHQSINWIKQSTTQLLRYDLWSSGVLVESELQTFSLNWYGIKEIIHLLEHLGFTEIECFGDYKKSFDPQTPYDVVSIKAKR